MIIIAIGPKQAPPLSNACKSINLLRICISRQSMGLNFKMIWFLKNTWETLVSQNMLVACKMFDSGMNCVYHQSSCFASLLGMTPRCSFDQLPKSVWATWLQLLFEHGTCSAGFVLHAFKSAVELWTPVLKQTLTFNKFEARIAGYCLYI